VKTDRAKSSAGEPAQATPADSGLIPADLKAKAIQALYAGLTATRRYWDKDQKAFVEEPDYGTRVKTAELVLAYAEGRPVERQVRLTGGFKEYNEKLEQLCSTPEGLAIAVKLGLVAEEPRTIEKKPDKRQKAELKRLATVSTTVEHAKNDGLPIRGNEKVVND
jgi:hypothetical protein